MGFRTLSRLENEAGADAGNAWSGDLPFSLSMRMVSLETWNNNADFMLSYDGTNFYDSFEIDPDRPLVLLFQTAAIRRKNTIVGAISKFQVLGMT